MHCLMVTLQPPPPPSPTQKKKKKEEGWCLRSNASFDGRLSYCMGVCDQILSFDVKHFLSVFAELLCQSVLSLDFLRPAV